MRTRPSRAAGFTLIELLVVIGIIAVLAAMVTIVGSRAFRAAGAAKLHSQLQIIEQAMEAYKTDFGSYPITSNDVTKTELSNINAVGFRGARTLCKALIAPGPQNKAGTATFDPINGNQDGAEGPGFRVPSRSGTFPKSGVLADGTTPALTGKVYGPYLAPEQFKVSKMALTANGSTQVGDLIPSDHAYDDTCVILDANDRPILYFPVLNPAPVITVKDGFIGDGVTASNPVSPMYRYEDNDYDVIEAGKRVPTRSGLDEDEFRFRMGDVNTNRVGVLDIMAPDGVITGDEKPVFRGKYILWMSGPDLIFGAKHADPAVLKRDDPFDDVTSFTQEQ